MFLFMGVVVYLVPPGTQLPPGAQLPPVPTYVPLSSTNAQIPFILAPRSSQQLGPKTQDLRRAPETSQLLLL